MLVFKLELPLVTACLSMAVLPLWIRAADEKPSVAGVKRESKDGEEGTPQMLVAPALESSVTRMDLRGKSSREWTLNHPAVGHPRPGLSGSLLMVGSLYPSEGISHTFRAATGRGGVLEMYSDTGDLIWEFVISSREHFVHHDALMLPNGNVLALVWHWKSGEECVAAGRLPEHMDLDGMWVDEIWELQPSGRSQARLVWRWSIWDSRVQSTYADMEGHGDPKELWRGIDLNQPPKPTRAWADLRRIEYCASEGLIAVWSQGFQEVWVIGHPGAARNTQDSPPAEAAEENAQETVSAGLLNRFGNPGIWGRKVSLKDMRLGFLDMAFVEERGEWSLGVLHRYGIESQPSRQVLHFIPVAGEKAVVDGVAGLPKLSSDQELNCLRLQLPVQASLRGFSAYGSHWLFTDPEKGAVYHVHNRGMARLVHQRGGAGKPQQGNELPRYQPLIRRASLVSPAFFN